MKDKHTNPNPEGTTPLGEGGGCGANGNITQITNGTTNLSYEYDEANQLVRENLYYGSGNASNATYTYTYDDWGNIIQKSVYAYTTGNVLEPRENFVLRFRSNLIDGPPTNMPSDVSVAPGETVRISLQVPQLPGFRFVKWNTVSNGSGTAYSPGAMITLNDDVTLYAQWEQVPRPTPTGEVIAEAPEPTHVPEYTISSASGSYPTQTFVYEYGNAEWGDMLTAIKRYNVDSIGLMTIVGTGTETFTHDAMGNPTSYGSKTLTWSGKQLTRYYYQPSRNQIYDYTYAYDENGLRTQKVLNGVTTSYYYNGSVLMGMVTGSGNTAIHQFFSYDSSGNVVSVDYSSNGGSTFTTYYYLRNAQNDVVKLIDGSGNTVVQYTYDSWGKPISTTGSLSATLGANQPFRYRGYVYDTETGWYYLQSRYYDPSICRFVSADVYLSTGQGVLGHNAFAYCADNPIVRIDSEGTFFTLVGALVGGLVGGVVSVASGGNFWEGAASGAAAGAVAGAAADIIALTAVTGGAAVAIVVGCGVASGVVGELVDSAFADDEDEKSTLSDYIVSGFVGGVMNLLTFGMGGGSSGIKEGLKSAKRLLVKLIKYGFTKEVTKK